MFIKKSFKWNRAKWYYGLMSCMYDVCIIGVWGEIIIIGVLIDTPFHLRAPKSVSL